MCTQVQWPICKRLRFAAARREGVTPPSLLALEAKRPTRASRDDEVEEDELEESEIDTLAVVDRPPEKRVMRPSFLMA